MTVTKESQVTSPEKSRELAKKGFRAPSMFEWVQQVDQYGKFNLLEENSNIGDPAYTVAEMIGNEPMKTLTFLIFCYKTRLKPDAVADYVISKL